MQKSMATMEAIVPDNSCTDYQIGGCRRRTSKNEPFGRRVEQQNKRHARRAEERVAEATNSGRPDATDYSDHDATVGHQLVRQYYTVLYRNTCGGSTPSALSTVT